MKKQKRAIDIVLSVIFYLIVTVIFGMFYLYYVLIYLAPTDETRNQVEPVIKTVTDTIAKENKYYKMPGVVYDAQRNVVYINVYDNVNDKSIIDKIEKNLLELNPKNGVNYEVNFYKYSHDYYIKNSIKKSFYKIEIKGE